MNKEALVRRYACPAGQVCLTAAMVITLVRLIVLAQLGMQAQMQTISDALLLPVPEPSPACHPAAKAQFFWPVFPRNTGGEDEQDTIERGKIIDAWSPAPRTEQAGGTSNDSNGFQRF